MRPAPGLYFRAPGDREWTDAAVLGYTRYDLSQLDVEVREVRVVEPVRAAPVMPPGVGAAWERWSKR